MKISVIDDDGIFQFLTKKLINKISGNHQVLPFNNGRQAYDFIKSNLCSADQLPQLVLLDINMPLMNGWQFLDCLRDLKNPEYRPVIYMVSSSVDQADLLKAKSYIEIKGYFNKPLFQQQLQELIESSSNFSHYAQKPDSGAA